MISQQVLLKEENCTINSTYTQLIQVIIFLLSLFVFKILFNKQNRSNLEKGEKAKNYLKEHEKENEEFFFGNSY